MIHVVMGPPCAGKTTFVRESMQDGDLVIDLDAICRALGYHGSHGAGGHYLHAAIAARSAVIDYAVGKGCTIWVIHSAPGERHLSWYRAHRAVLHTIDPGVEECLRRARDGERPPGTSSAIRDWYSKRGRPLKKSSVDKCSRTW